MNDNKEEEYYYEEENGTSRREKKRSDRRFTIGFLTGSFCTLAVCALVIGLTLIFTGRINTPALPFTLPGQQQPQEQQPQEQQSGTAETQPAQQEQAQESDLLAPGAAAFALQFQAKAAEIGRIIDETFIFPVDEEKMMDGALKGYMSGLDDIYSQYYTPKEYMDTMNESDGSFVGIGVVVQQDTATNAVNVLTVYPGSPAEAGGMQKDDVIIKVEGEDVAAWPLSDVVKAIRGEENTPVNITVYRAGEEIDISMIRKSITKITVEKEMLENNIGYIRLTEFDSVSVEQMRDAVKELKRSGMKKLVLDLRDNPGGLLTAVVSIADDFLPKADVLYIDDKKGNRVTYDSGSSEIFDGPMTVLINGNSASASEVLSGALKDNGRAVIVGEQSFGKGIVQTFYQLSDGSGIKLTTAHYFTPAGNDIHGVGIAPDVEVKDDRDTEEDEQLVKAVEEIGKKN